MSFVDDHTDNMIAQPYLPFPSSGIPPSIHCCIILKVRTNVLLQLFPQFPEMHPALQVI